MAVTLGIDGATDATGWTTHDPIPDSVFTTWTAQEGSGYTGNGSRIIYCDMSGAAGGTGTLLDPVHTVPNALSLVRNQMPDHVRFKRGGVVADTLNHFTAANLGAIPSNTADLSTYKPMVIESYGTGARPIFQVPLASNNDCFFSWSGGPVVNQYIVFRELEFYPPTRVPTDGAFVLPNYNGTGISITLSLGLFVVEDCKIHHFCNAFSMGPILASGYSQDRLIIRRNQVYNNWDYSPSTKGGQGIHSNAITTLFQVSENYWDNCGTSLGLDAYIDLTVNPNSTPGFSVGSGNYLFANGVGVTLKSSGTLPSPFLADHVYVVLNRSAAAFKGACTFDLAEIATPNTAITPTTAGAGTVQIRWSDSGRDIYQRNMYFGYDTGVGCMVTSNGDISFRSGSEAVQYRPGVNMTGLFCYGGSGGFFFTQGEAQHFVVMGQDDIYPNNANGSVDASIMPRGQGILIDYSINANTGAPVPLGRAYAHDGIVAHNKTTCEGVNAQWLQVSNRNAIGVAGALVQNVIVRDWWNDFLDQDPAGTNTIGPNQVYLTGTLATLADFATHLGLSGTTVDDVANYYLSRGPGVWDATYSGQYAYNYFAGVSGSPIVHGGKALGKF